MIAEQSAKNQNKKKKIERPSYVYKLTRFALWHVFQ